MEFKEGAVKPPSIRDLLRQQINEQSEQCDVTVKAGEWSKKFHWCILVASPFFEAINRNQSFQEQSTGIIELHIQHPYTIVEGAILFLYGRRPKITIQNIGGLLEMAEFLLLPTLKAQCVKWLKNTDASCENFFQILHLASVLDLYLPSLEEFIRGNLLELLDKDVAVTLDKETIIDIFNDTDLSYVSVKQLFSFLVSWTKADLRREAYFAELFSLLDVSDVDEELHRELLDETFVTRLGPSVLETIKPSLGETTQVVIFPLRYNKQSNACFIIGSGRWCVIHGDITDIIGIEDKTPLVYKNNGYSSSTILFHDLSCQNENETTTELVNKATVSALDDVDQIMIVPSKCYAIVRQQVCKKQAAAATGRERFHYASRRPKYCINLYRGVLQASQTSMEPLVCFLEESSVSHLAVDMNNNIAIVLQGNAEVIIFIDAECFVERIRLRMGYRHNKDFRLTARNSGFVLTSNRLIYLISAVHGQSLHKRFQIEKIVIPERGVYSKYIVCRNICFRFMRLKYNGQLTFSYTNVDNLKKGMTEEANWVKEDLPDCCKMKRDTDIGASAFMVTLPKHMLRCSLNCPHCVVKEKRTERAAKYRYEDYDFEYEDYYDYDDCCGYDSDDYPYYSD